ncbi:MAG TPA: Gfo/Idh/MocA family oxidoreductase [Tepidisphaeraceae bacterium]|nr:Gfo/Idh/MocA family oxidoreductase [Tepidisphaeraceae bacterium]
MNSKRFKFRLSAALAALVAACVVTSNLAFAADDAKPDQKKSEEKKAEEKKPVEVALVGVAHIHTPHFIEILRSRPADVKVKYVWDDHNPDLAKEDAQKLNAPVVDDIQKIWSDPDIKAVIICSETNRHQPLVMAAAQTHKHIYAEKPLGMGAQDAYAMARAIDQAGVLFETGYFMRSDPKILFIREQIQKHAFGTITRVRGANTHNGALGGWFDHEWQWMADPKQAGVGAYGDLGTHSLDILLWLIGDVDRTTAVTSEGTHHYPPADEFGEGMLVFKDGVLGTLAAGWDDLVADPVSLEVCGTEGHAVIVDNLLYFRSKQIKGSTDRRPYLDLPKAWPEPMEMFIDAINGQQEPLVTADEAAYRSAVMQALYDGAKGQRWTQPMAPLSSQSASESH